ncbi:MAG TPA: hypothetical protein VI877_02485, partial [Dehalococcoidia bacterium]|nr:hypothetical protein [Dehalococcoidia bacterium]
RARREAMTSVDRSGTPGGDGQQGNDQCGENSINRPQGRQKLGGDAIMGERVTWEGFGRFKRVKGV